MPDMTTLIVCLAGVLLISFVHGAFGGGFAIVGIPLLSLVMDPIQAGALLAPLFILMSFTAMIVWRPGTWSKPDLVVLLPSLVVGVGLGFVLLRVLDKRAVAILIGLMTLVFAGLWLKGGGRVEPRPRSRAKGLAAGAGSGFATMIAHSGGPPLAMYLLPLGLAKEVYAGTTAMFFMVGNILKAGPWLLLAERTPRFWTLMALLLPAIPLGVWVGWRFHQRLDALQLYRWCYGLLVVTALKLLWDGIGGYLW